MGRPYVSGAKYAIFLHVLYRNSKTAQRELQNRQNVEDMQEAMNQLNALSDMKRIEEITKRQVCLINLCSHV